MIIEMDTGGRTMTISTINLPTERIMKKIISFASKLGYTYKEYGQKSSDLDFVHVFIFETNDSPLPATDIFIDPEFADNMIAITSYLTLERINFITEMLSRLDKQLTHFMGYHDNILAVYKVKTEETI